MAERVADDVWLLDLGLVFPLGSNGYLVDDGEVTLIDPGLPVNRPSLASELADAGYDLAEVDRTLVTHFDLSHVGGLRYLSSDTGPVYLSPDALALARGEFRRRHRHHKALYHRLVRRLFGLPAGLTYETVDDGETVGRFTAYHTPGHNPGHTVYVHDSGVAFLGDLVWERAGELTPPFWLDSYDMRSVTESIRSFADRVDPFAVAAMAHGEPIRAGGYDALRECAREL
jgi:glyoxylase-like metal-dependent hydrolase (beta-lactamase superfamily II)